MANPQPTPSNLKVYLLAALLALAVSTIVSLLFASHGGTEFAGGTGAVYVTNNSATPTAAVKVANMTVTDTLIPGGAVYLPTTAGALSTYFNTTSNKTGLCLRNATGTMTVAGVCAG